MPSQRKTTGNAAAKGRMPFKPPRSTMQSTESRQSDQRRKVLSVNSDDGSEDLDQNEHNLVSSEEEEDSLDDARRSPEHTFRSNPKTNIKPATKQPVQGRKASSTAAAPRLTRPSVKRTADVDSPPSVEIDDSTPSIPEKLLTRLLHDSFSSGETKIGKEAMAVFTKYIETFAREAIARAIKQRENGQYDRGRGTLGGAFLQVEDLEKLAAQLVLDF